jgi:hypothetical protein
MTLQYEKTTCPTCLHSTDNAHLILGKVNEEFLKPLGLEFYDFGGGQCVAPIPDFDGVGYLTGHMVAVTGEPYDKFTAVGIDYNKLSEEHLIEPLKRAVDQYKVQQEPYKFIP